MKLIGPVAIGLLLSSALAGCLLHAGPGEVVGFHLEAGTLYPKNRYLEVYDRHGGYIPGEGHADPANPDEIQHLTGGGANPNQCDGGASYLHATMKEFQLGRTIVTKNWTITKCEDGEHYLLLIEKNGDLNLYSCDHGVERQGHRPCKPEDGELIPPAWVQIG